MAVHPGDAQDQPCSDWDLSMLQSPTHMKVLADNPMYSQILRGVARTGPQHHEQLVALVKTLVNRCIQMEATTRTALLNWQEPAVKSVEDCTATLETANAVGECQPFDDPLT